MPEDKRILKTRRNLKETLVALLQTQPFEQISVTALCAAAQTSRITFYTHYEDKCALLSDLLDDFVQRAREDYYRLQHENNPGDDTVKSYCNFLDCILDMYYQYLSFFSHISPQENPYLYAAFYQMVSENLVIYMHRKNRTPALKYTPRQMAALLCNGLWGFISQSIRDGMPHERCRREARTLLQDVLSSKALMR